jgi:FkbM family methyltransferase
MALTFEEIRLNTVFLSRADRIMELFYAAICSPDRDVIDGGANYGRHLFPLAAAVPHGRVVGFEPIPDIADCLDRRIAAEGLTRRVLVRREALAALTGSAEFVYFDEPDPRFTHQNVNAAYSALKPTPHSVRTKKFRLLSVPTVTLDSVVRSDGLDIQFIKLDLEGGEYDALRGSAATIAGQRPVVIFEDGGPAVVTAYGYEDTALLSFFLERAYQLYYLSGHELVAAEWLARDYQQNWRPNNLVAIPNGSTALWPLRRAINQVASDSLLPLSWSQD